MHASKDSRNHRAPTNPRLTVAADACGAGITGLFRSRLHDSMVGIIRVSILPKCLGFGMKLSASGAAGVQERKQSCRLWGLDMTSMQIRTQPINLLPPELPKLPNQARDQQNKEEVCALSMRP